MKLLHKLLLGFLGVALLIWVAGYLAVHLSEEALQKAFVENTDSLAREIIHNVDRDVHDKIEVFEAYLSDTILQDKLIESNHEFEKLDNIQAYIIKKDREWTSAPKEEVTPFMQDIIDNRLSEEMRERIEFYEKKYRYKVYGEVFVTNRYGANAAQTRKTTDFRQDDEEWWKTAKKTGSYIRDIEYDESADIYSTDVALRIDDEDGNFIGVMKVVMNIEKVIDSFKESHKWGMHKEHKTMGVHLLTENGQLIYANNEGREFLSDFSFLLPDPGHVSGTHQHIRLSSKSFINKDFAHGELFITYSYSSGYKNYKGLNWIVALVHKKEDIFAPVTKLKFKILSISLTVTLIAVIMGFLLSASIVKHIRRLRNAAIKIGKGKQDITIEVSSRDEIGELAHAFNQMTEDLRQANAEREKLTAELKVLSLNDDLTKLYNRRGFFALARQQIKMAFRQKKGIYLLFADIDNFKKINDTLGHKAGDTAIMDFADVLRKNYRSSDIIARVGGDEFAVIPVGVEGDSPDAIASRLQETIDTRNAESKRSYELSASIGITYYDPQHPCSIDELLNRADRLMYKQKNRKKSLSSASPVQT